MTSFENCSSRSRGENCPSSRGDKSPRVFPSSSYSYSYSYSIVARRRPLSAGFTNSRSVETSERHVGTTRIIEDEDE